MPWFGLSQVLTSLGGLTQNLLPLKDLSADFIEFYVGLCRVKADHKKQSCEGGEPGIHKREGASNVQEEKWPRKMIFKAHSMKTMLGKEHNARRALQYKRCSARKQNKLPSD